MKTFVITRENIEEFLTMDMVIEAVEDAYRLYSEDQVELLPALSIDVEKHNGEVSLKSGYDQKDEVVGVKLASGYYSNPENYGLPSALATILLSDGKSGLPLAIMDGGLITNMRTGAAGAVSAKYLARRDSKKVAIIGTGIQARMQLLATTRLFDLDEVFIWGRDEQKIEQYISEMSGETKLKFTACKSPADCVKEADIIITTTPSDQALVKLEDVKPGTHIACIGTDLKGKQEIDARLFENTKVVVDSFNQCKDFGEVQHALKQGLITEQTIHAEIGEIILGNKAGRETAEEITVFDSTGLSIQDITTAKRVLNYVQVNNKDLAIDLI